MLLIVAACAGAGTSRAMLRKLIKQIFRILPLRLTVKIRLGDRRPRR